MGGCISVSYYSYISYVLTIDSPPNSHSGWSDSCFIKPCSSRWLQQSAGQDNKNLPILPPCEELLPPTTPKDSSEAPFEAVLARDGFFLCAQFCSPSSPPPLRLRMSGRSTRSKVPTRLLFADPFQKRLKRRRSSKRHQRRIELFQLAVREDRVQLLVARLAERRSLLRLSPARFGMKMVQGNQLGRHFSPA